MEMSTLDYIKAALIFLILIFGLVFTLTYTNIVRCSTIGQSWCDMYWYLVGQPKILVAYGHDGLGNAEKLMAVLADREILGIRTQPQVIDHIKTTSYLEKYKMVIVTQAKTMSTEEIEMFHQYASKGGILVWTGDAGTKSYQEDRKLSDYNIKDTNPWTRVNKNDQIIPFGELLSAEYIDNFCGFVNCTTLNQEFVGYLKQDPDSTIATGIAPNTAMYGDFAIVTPINNTSTFIEVNIDYGTNMISKDPKDKKGLGNFFPLIIRSQLGKNVIYISAPIEYIIHSPSDNTIDPKRTTNIPTTIRNLFKEYFGTAK